MPDDADRAFEQIERRLESQRAVRRPTLEYTGHCHHCGDITGGGRKFCDADCRDDYQVAKERARVAGI